MAALRAGRASFANGQSVRLMDLKITPLRETPLSGADDNLRSIHINGPTSSSHQRSQISEACVMP